MLPNHISKITLHQQFISSHVARQVNKVIQPVPKPAGSGRGGCVYEVVLFSPFQINKSFKKKKRNFQMKTEKGIKEIDSVDLTVKEKV